MRMLMRPLRIALGYMIAAGALLCLGTHTANAATIDVYASMPYTYMSFTNIAVPISTFNVSNGTLTGITVQLTGNGELFFSAQNQDPANSLNFSGLIGGTEILSLTPSGAALDSVVMQTTVSGTLTPNGTAGDTFTISPNPFLVSGVTSSNSTAVTAAWLSSTSPTINLYLSGTKIAPVCNNGWWTEEDWVKSDASIKVTYTYDSPTPEPFSMSLAGTGLVAVAFFARKRLTRSK